jgi:mRNA-degrading endonuclease toxin of MazEF toxin-antitoxin module
MAEPVDGSAFDRGHVVWHEGLFRGSSRPWLVLSDDRHPFHGREYLVAGITTTERDAAIALPDDAWAVGGLPRPSYASPWFLTTLKHARIDRGVGALAADVTDRIVTEAARYLGAVE